MAGDSFDLDRFVRAQEGHYAEALSEIRRGHKRSHWMWFIFPQLRGLGSSATSVHFGISGVAEAGAYLAHPVLGPRLLECAQAVLSHPDASASSMFGYPDDVKLRSSATLFSRVAADDSPFHRIIDTFFGGEFDQATLRLLEAGGGPT